MARGGAAQGLIGAPAPDDEAIEQGRHLFAQACRFLTAAAEPAGLPAAQLPEVAFAGRSNVGKSSLINALTGRKTLARISRTPGRTRQINFFTLGDRLALVDLPGYGYARAPKHEIAAWTRLIGAYLKGRVSLRRVCLLVDARHGLKAADRELMGSLDAAAVSYQVVLTKADKARPAELEALLAALEAELGRRAAAYPGIWVTSVVGRRGIDELRAAVAALAAPN